MCSSDLCALFVGTDMGTVNSEVREMLARSTCAVLESNHDPVLLEQSDRPLSLKQRIRGRTGHLSNDDAGETAAELVKAGARQIVLGHLSKENNSPDLALKSTYDAVGRYGAEVIVSSQDRETEFSEQILKV